MSKIKLDEKLKQVKESIEKPDHFLTSAASATENLNLAPIQKAYFRSKARFNVVPAGRRSGKTAIAKRRLRRRALERVWPIGTRFIAAAPTFNQAKRIYWNDFLQMFPEYMRRERVNKTELIIPLITGADIQVMGMEVPQRVEGSPVAHLLLDEYGNMKGEAWGENLYPALIDHQGTADIIGVPEGRNHYYRMYRDAKRYGSDSEWATFTWLTSDILPYYLGPDVAAKELAHAQAHMDLMTYQQEFEASFLNFTGRAYYCYDEDLHAAERVHYNPNKPLIFAFDFNVAPGVCAVCQEVLYRGKRKNVSKKVTAVIGEVWIPRGSNTKRVVEKLIAEWGPEGRDHQGDVFIYGDATGGAKGTAKVEGSDWDIIRNLLKPVFGDRIRDRVEDSNPRERVRVNSVNTRLQAADGMISLIVDPVNASHVCNDLDGVTVLEGTAGEIDKDTDPELTHISDALGYYIALKHPVQSGGGLISVAA